MQATIPITSPVTRLPGRSVPHDKRVRYLERLLQSVTFRRAGQLRRLLEWLAERSAAGAASPREQEIARAVLGRADFDPQTDSLVRKEMSRLRQKLGRYYLSEGSSDEVVVRASGGYRLEFEWAGASNLRGEIQPKRRCVVVLPFRHNPELVEEGLELQERIQIHAGKTGQFEMVAVTTALACAARRTDVKTMALDCGADWVVEGSVRRRAQGLEATVWVVDGGTGRVRGIGRVIPGDVEAIAGAVAKWLIRA
jgi:TolB-like protein